MRKTLKTKPSGQPAPCRRQPGGTGQGSPAPAKTLGGFTRKVAGAQSDAAPLTRADHLAVQTAIERQAHEFWCADNRDSSHRMDHWLLAETRVLTDFCNSQTAVFDFPDSSTNRP